MVSRSNKDVAVRPVSAGAYLSSSIVAGLIAAAEILLTVGSGLLIHFFYVVDETEKATLYYAAIVIYTLLMLQAFLAQGLYRFSQLLKPRQQIAKIFGTCVMLFLFLTAGAFSLKISADFSRVWGYSWLIATIVGVTAIRFTAVSLVRRLARQGKVSRNIVIYGGGEQGSRLVHHLVSLSEPWNRVVAVFDERGKRTGPFIGGFPVTGGIDKLIDWCRQRRIDEILIALPWSAQERIVSLLKSLGELPVNVRLSPEFGGQDLLLRRTTNQFSVPMLSLLEKPVTGWGAISKLMLDYTAGILALLLLSPILLLVALVIKLDSPGPVLFRQQRYGFNNQMIGVYKFRTMYTDQTDENADKLATRNDPRVTRVGGFLRRLSIDELPQLFNVLCGEMSVVGPRPHAKHAKAGSVRYEDVVDQYAQRHRVKPGITGWAQVNGWRGETRDEASLLGRLEHDLYYIEHWSIWFDISIMLRTVFSVIRGENSY